MTDHRTLPRHARAKHALDTARDRIVFLEARVTDLQATNSAYLQRARNAERDQEAGLTRALEIVRDLAQRGVVAAAPAALQRELDGYVMRRDGRHGQGRTH